MVINSSSTFHCNSALLSPFAALFALPFAFSILHGKHQPWLFISQQNILFPQLALMFSAFPPFFRSSSLANGHINMAAFDRMAAIVGAFTKHMQAMKAAQAPSSGEYEHFCRHMQQTTKLGEAGK